MITRRNLLTQGSKMVLSISILDTKLTLSSIADFADSLSNNFNIQIFDEEKIYKSYPANNGADPMWAHGCTSIVRFEDCVFACGLEIDPDVEGISNCRWLLFKKYENGWMLEGKDLLSVTREPCPLAIFQNGTLVLSINPKYATPCIENCRTRPGILFFLKGNLSKSYSNLMPPNWGDSFGYNDHSYRALGVDGEYNELILFQNYFASEAKWSFLDHSSEWLTSGSLKWPVDSYDGKEVPLRLCYSNVFLKKRAVWFFSTVDIIEPKETWRKYKKELTGNNWDYVFRRLFFSWNQDVTTNNFEDWIEIANHDATGGTVSNRDLWIDNKGRAHLLWTEIAVDENLRDHFFPGAKQYMALNYTTVYKGKVEKTVPIFECHESDSDNLYPGTSRFHITPDERLFVIYYVKGRLSSNSEFSENQIIEIYKDGRLGTSKKIPFKLAFTNFQTATPRAGSLPSYWVDILGYQEGNSGEITYGRIRIT